MRHPRESELTSGQDVSHCTGSHCTIFLLVTGSFSELQAHFLHESIAMVIPGWKREGMGTTLKSKQCPYSLPAGLKALLCTINGC